MRSNNIVHQDGWANKVDPFNVLRVIAALSVFLHHAITFEEKNLFFKIDGLTFLLRTNAWGGVYVFFVMGGFFAGKAFVTTRYDMNIKGFFHYYWQRIKKTVLPTFGFIFICATICYPSFIVENPNVIIRFLTFTYNGSPGASGIGACWYVFTLFWLWISTPFVCLFLEKIKTKKWILAALWVVLMVAGFTFRLYGFKAGWSWDSVVYKPPFANLDLYFGGVLTAYFSDCICKKECEKKGSDGIKIVAIIVLAVAFLSNWWIYNKSYFDTGVMVGELPLWRVYNYICKYGYPTVYLIAVSLFAFAFNSTCEIRRCPVSWSAVRSNPLRVIDSFAEITFEFYLFHSLVLKMVAPVVGGGDTLKSHLWFLFVNGFITLIYSYAYHELTKALQKRK